MNLIHGSFLNSGPTEKKISKIHSISFGLKKKTEFPFIVLKKSGNMLEFSFYDINLAHKTQLGYTWYGKILEVQSLIKL
jgi:hypothetical protein